MSVNRALINALEDFDIPCKTEPYRGDEERFFTFNIASDSGTDFGDDSPGFNRLIVYLHYWLPINHNYLEEKKEIRKMLVDAGFSYPSVTLDSAVPDREGYRHIVFQTEYIQEV